MAIIVILSRTSFSSFLTSALSHYLTLLLLLSPPPRGSVAFSHLLLVTSHTEEEAFGSISSITKATGYFWGSPPYFYPADVSLKDARILDPARGHRHALHTGRSLRQLKT